jgi:hypothetical protein
MKILNMLKLFPPPASTQSLRLSLALVAGFCLVQSLPAQVTLTDIGSTAPVAGPYDIYQTNWSGGAVSPDGLNYYFDNSMPPGQTFTTGSDPNGYIVTSLALQTAGNSGGLPAGGQAYLLRFYAVSDVSNTTLIASFTSATNFTFTDDDWLRWTNLGLALPPNAEFAYSFGRIGSGGGWENMATMGSSPTVYGSSSSGDVALIPTGGGYMTLGSSDTFVATFDLGLKDAAGAPVADAPLFLPSSAVVTGTAVTVSAVAAGTPSLSYQWCTDGGSGGALTNIPGATSATLSLNTANWNPGPYQYDVVVSNASGVVTSAVAALGIVYPTVAAILTDSGDTIVSGVYDISQFVGSGSGNGLNYYDDNGASHGGNYTGQTFTTGTNSQGYYIDSVAIQTGGTGGAGSTTVAQEYHLFIYSIEGLNATLLAHYTNANFSFTFGDWLTWSGFSIILKPNSTYAYAFGRDSSGTGWAALNYSPTNAPGPYTNGVICIIPGNGGAITPGAGYSAAVFDVGLLPIGVGPSPVAFANPLTASPGRVVTAGTQVTLNENASGQAPLHYYWQTDGGTGTITNIPGNDSSNLVLNTTGWNPGVYQFDVTASNSFGFSKSAVLDLIVLYANTTATLTDIGASTPSIETNDVAQPTTGTSLSEGGSPDGLNYYFDNANPPGQVFTTGTNAGGYVLSSLAIPLGGGSGNIPAAGQQYILRLYSVSGTTATLYAIYGSATNFTYTDFDWLRWSGFSVPLAANATYAYTFGRISSGVGWEALSCVSNSPPVYNGGACVIPTTGGQIMYSKSRDQDATFIIGLDAAQDPVVTPPAVSPSGVIYAGTSITLSAGVSGPGPYTYQWLTDGGSGGALTNIPSATNSTLTIGTATMGGYTFQYALLVSNSVGSTISETTTLAIQDASTPTVIDNISPGSCTIFAGGSVTFTASFAGTLPITYQWQVNKGTTYTNLTGQTGTNLTLSNLSVSDSGTYILTATNSVGSNATGGAPLTVVPVPAPPFTVNFQWHSTEGGNDVGDYSGAGIPGYGTGTYWNQLIGPTAWSPGTYAVSNTLADNGSTPTGMSWTLVTGGSWDWTSTPTIPLLDSGASAYYPTPQTFTFSLPNGLYNLVFFTCDGTQATNRDSVNVVTVNGIKQTAAPTNDNAFVLGGTYVTFNDVVVTGTTLTGTWAAGNSTQNLAVLNGAQVQYLGPAVSMNAQLLANGQVQLRWSAGTLLQAPALTGPWTTNSAPSPYTVTPTPTAPQMFYKIIAP